MIYKKLLYIIFSTFILSLFSCELLNINPEKSDTDEIIPIEVSIDLPSSISSPPDLKVISTTQVEGIYNDVRNFVEIAKTANQIVAKSYQRILALEIKGIQEFSYTSIDGNTKYVSIRENYSENGRTWQYYMEIYNESFSELALKAYWNANPLEQLIIFSPSKLNVNEMQEHPNAIVKLEFKKGELASPYEKSILIGINGLNTSETKPCCPNNLLLFVGQSNNILDIIGSTNNPNSITLNPLAPVGRNWSFRGKVDVEKNIAAIELAIAPCTLVSTQDLMIDYAVKNVFVSDLRTMHPELIQLSDDELLQQTGINPATVGSPIYYNANGFFQAGSDCPPEYSGILNFEYLETFVPVEVRDIDNSL